MEFQDPAILMEHALGELEDLARDALVEAAGQPDTNSLRVAAFFRSACISLELSLQMVTKAESLQFKKSFFDSYKDKKSEELRSILPEQCVEARQLLKWTRQELATAAEVPLWFIEQFENGEDILECWKGLECEMQRAFEIVGIRFSFEKTNGCVRSTGTRYVTRDTRETH